MKNGSISKDFPLYHSNLIPLYQKHDEKIYDHGKKQSPKSVNYFTNEHPDFFRLEGMRQSGYRNPYLDEVLKVDRNEQLKKMNYNAKQINLIDYIKSNRQFSQDPNVLRLIRNEFDIQMHKKRQQISEDRKKKGGITKKYELNMENIKNYATIIRKLDDHTSKINYKMKKTMKEENDKKIGRYTCSAENFKKINKISCQFDPKKSAYITNSNDYKISEAYSENEDNVFSHKRKNITQLNLINYRKDTVTLPPNKNQKWSPFYENYVMLMLNNKTGFGQKGGLFTEFTNKNIGVININKRNLKEKMKKNRQLFNHYNNSTKNMYRRGDDFYKYKNRVEMAINTDRGNKAKNFDFIMLNKIKNPLGNNKY